MDIILGAAELHVSVPAIALIAVAWVLPKVM